MFLYDSKLTQGSSEINNDNTGALVSYTPLHPGPKLSYRAKAEEVVAAAGALAGKVGDRAPPRAAQQLRMVPHLHSLTRGAPARFVSSRQGKQPQPQPRTLLGAESRLF